LKHKKKIQFQNQSQFQPMTLLDVWGNVMGWDWDWFWNWIFLCVSYLI